MFLGHQKTILIILACVSHASASTVDYDRDIKPLLAEKCTTCHGALKQEAGLRLDHGRLLRRGSDDGPVLDYEQVADSRLLQRVTAEHVTTRMPPEGEGQPLTDEQIELLTEWINTGANSPVDEVVPASPDAHWAWQVPSRPAIPDKANDAWSENPIDAFVFAKLREHQLRPLPTADKRTLLRRLYFDLIGLPPTPDQQRAFLASAAPHAWSDVVDQLLEHPAHGERWARHWMDVWRYSDWDGFKNELRGSQRHIWRWRDWITESLNRDRGYDQMILEMLAGDELAPSDANTLRATGFLARNYHKSNRNIWLDATVEHTAKAFLGLTINCARCHDHKYDPVSQHDYYAFRAIFEPHHVRTERLAGQSDTNVDGLARAFDKDLDQATYLLVAGNEKHPDKDHPIDPAIPAMFQTHLKIASVSLPVDAAFPALRSFVEREDTSLAEQKLADARNHLRETERVANVRTGSSSDHDKYELQVARQKLRTVEAEWASLKARWAADKARYGTSPANVDKSTLYRRAAVAEHRARIEDARLLLLQQRHALSTAEKTARADAPESQKAVEQARRELEAAQEKLEEITKTQTDEQYTPVGNVYPGRSTGRRLALARWIAHEDNPLTARVAVNYVWMHYFGEPLVANVFDFGMRSPEPPHRRLLDWLAVELIQHDWSLKHLHRLITHSQTYRRASFVSDEPYFTVNQRRDPDNELLWRANTRRLEAEAIRDSLFHVAGNLDLALGGPDLDFALGETVPRRSIYFRHAYEKQMTMLVLFDAAAPTECYRRKPSIIPQQALALANSPVSFDQARSLAKQLSAVARRSAGGDAAATTFVKSAFVSLLCRECTPAELTACLDFLATQSKLLADQQVLTPFSVSAQSTSNPSGDIQQRARENLIHTLMNHHDFVTIR